MENREERKKRLRERLAEGGAEGEIVTQAARFGLAALDHRDLG